MNPFGPSYTPVIKADDLKAPHKPKARPNVYDTGTPEQRMANAAKPLPTRKGGVDLKPSTM